MTMHNSNIVYFAGAEGAPQLGFDLRDYPDLSLQEFKSPLGGMDAATTALAREHGVLLFRAQGNNERDAQAVAAIRRSLGPEAIILALTDASTSLAEARMLNEAGVNEVLPDTIGTEALVAQIYRHSGQNTAAAAPAAKPAAQGKIITVAPARGGVGATTLAINLANSLLDRRGFRTRKARNKVVIVDLDLQFGTVASGLDIDPRDGFYAMASDGTLPDDTFLAQSLIDLPSGLSVFSAPSRMIPLDAIRPEQITSLLTALRAHYDYVVVDLPRTLVGWVSAVLSDTDKLLLVTDSSVPSVRQARRLLDLYEEDNLALPVEIVVSGESKPMLPGANHKEAARLLGRPLAHWLPHDPKAARTAIDRGMPLEEAARGSALRKKISAIAAAMHAEFENKSANKDKR